jgi:hypothetical protein
MAVYDRLRSRWRSVTAVFAKFRMGGRVAIRQLTTRALRRPTSQFSGQVKPSQIANSQVSKMDQPRSWKARVFHHLMAVHRWGWGMVLHPDGMVTVTSPDGGKTLHGHGPPPRRSRLIAAR